jgi:hypothetical protein
MQLGRNAAHAGHAVSLQANHINIDIGGVLVNCAADGEP